MRVRMLSTAAGPNGVMVEGSVQNLPLAVALPLLEGGYAVALEDLSQIAAETAVVEPGETAVLAAEEKAILEPLEVAGRKRRKGR